MFKLFFSDDVWQFGTVIAKESYSAWNSTLTLTLCAWLLLVAVIAYLLGAVNTAIILTKFVYREDIRKKGSGNAGMTNVMRNYGWGPAVITLFGDMLKCMFAMMVGTALLGINGAYVAGLMCVVGHVAPVYYKFKGGKGVAAMFMFILYINFWAFIIIGLLFILLVWASRYLSLGSIMSAFIMPLVIQRFDWYGIIEPIRVLASLTVMLIVVYKHRANIGRIWNKTESRFSFKRTAKKAEITAAEAAPEQSPELDEETKKRKEENRKKSAKKKK